MVEKSDGHHLNQMINIHSINNEINPQCVPHKIH